MPTSSRDDFQTDNAIRGPVAECLRAEPRQLRRRRRKAARLNLIANGLGDPERPDWGGWGVGVDGHWHTSNRATIWRWRAAFQNDFAARMDWTIKPYAG